MFFHFFPRLQLLLPFTAWTSRSLNWQKAVSQMNRQKNQLKLPQSPLQPPKTPLKPSKTSLKLPKSHLKQLKSQLKPPNNGLSKNRSILLWYDSSNLENLNTQKQGTKNVPTASKTYHNRSNKVPKMKPKNVHSVLRSEHIKKTKSEISFKLGFKKQKMDNW